MVISQELKCLCHFRKWLPCFPCGLLTLAKETGGRVASSEWMKHRECPRCFRSKKFRLMYWTYFPMPKPIQMAADGYEAIMSWKSPIDMTRTFVSTVRTKNLPASFVQRLLNMYSNSCVGFFVVASLHIARASACDNRFVWGDVYFLVLEKLKVWNSACQERKEFFLVCIVLQNRVPVSRNLGLWSNLWYYLPCMYPKQCPPVYLTGDDSEWMGWRRFQHSYQKWKQLWMEEHEQQLLYQRSCSHKMEVNSAVLF